MNDILGQRRIRLEMWLASPAAQATPSATPRRLVVLANGRTKIIPSMPQAEWLKKFK